MDREEMMLRRVIFGATLFLCGVGLGYWWHFMAVG